MKKQLFLILSALIAGILSPNPTIADGEVVISGLDSSYDTETVIPATPAAPVVVTKLAPRVAVSTTAKVAPRLNSISITGRTLDVVRVTSPEVNAGTHVNLYGDKFLYGHNSNAVFGALKNLSIGSTFTVTLNGQPTTYRVAKMVTFEKNNGKLQLDGSGTYMNAVVKARFDGAQYNVSIMTCAGVNYGNGDASHRLVVFADKI